MKSVQEVFDHLQELKKEKKTYLIAYKEALNNVDNYKEIVMQAGALRLRKKQIEEAVKKEMGKNYEKLEELKEQIEDEKGMLSDVALTTLMGGETVKAEDERGGTYNPVWSVKFKKGEQQKLFNN